MKQPHVPLRLGGGSLLSGLPSIACRLHACSDYHVMDVCANCGLLISTVNVPHTASDTAARAISSELGSQASTTCRLCSTGAPAGQSLAQPNFRTAVAAPSRCAPAGVLRREICRARRPSVCVQVPCQRACGHEHPLLVGHHVACELETLPLLAPAAASCTICR